MCAHGARMAKFRRRTRRHRESLRNSLFNNRAFLLSVFRFFIARADEALSPASSRAFGTQTLVSEIAEQSGRRPGAPSPALHRQSRPVRRAIDRIAPIPSSATAPSQTGFGSSRQSKPSRFPAASVRATENRIRDIGPAGGRNRSGQTPIFLDSPNYPAQTRNLSPETFPPMRPASSNTRRQPMRQTVDAGQ